MSNIQVFIESQDGVILPTSEKDDGTPCVCGTLDENYQIRVRNKSASRIEIVISVDGKDVMSGKDASFSLRGYIVDAYNDLVVKGFRISNTEINKFVFAPFWESEGAQSPTALQTTGVIGVAVFKEFIDRSSPSISDYLEQFKDPQLAQWVVPNLYGSHRIFYSSNTTGYVPPFGSLGTFPSSSGTFTSTTLSCGKSSASSSTSLEMPNVLGTKAGEKATHIVKTVDFTRKSQVPSSVLAIEYDTKDNWWARGVSFKQKIPEVAKNPFPQT